MLRFNSILVRLKVGGYTAAEIAEKLFQFHTGSIKSARHPRCVLRSGVFQFHTGSIKSAINRKRSEMKRVSIPYWFD